MNNSDTTDYAGNGSSDYGKLTGNQKDLITQLFNELGLDGTVLPAGKSGKIPFGQIKKYLNNNGNNNALDTTTGKYERMYHCSCF